MKELYYIINKFIYLLIENKIDFSLHNSPVSPSVYINVIYKGKDITFRISDHNNQSNNFNYNLVVKGYSDKQIHNILHSYIQKVK
jgi:hypothetical protein